MNEPARQFFPERAKLFDDGKCTECKEPRDHIPFRDEISRRESEISGFCQRCQDKVFGA